MVDSKVRINFLGECLEVLTSNFAITEHVDAIRRMTVWLRNRNITLHHVLNSNEAIWCSNIINNKFTSIEHFNVAVELLRLIIVSFDVTSMQQSDAEEIIKKFLMLEILFNEFFALKNVEKYESICKILTVLAEKFLTHIINGSESGCSSRILNFLTIHAHNQNIAVIILPFWNKFAKALNDKNRKVKWRFFEVFVEELILNLITACKQFKIKSFTMETDCDLFVSLNF